MKKLSHACLYSANADFIEQLYEAYLSDPDSVDADWRQYFDALRADDHLRQDIPHGPVREKFARLARQRPAPAPTVGSAPLSSQQSAHKQVSVLQLINAYRFRGHRQAELDPLKQYQRPNVPELEPGFHGLSEADLDTEFNTGSLVAPDSLKLRDILEQVRATYCGPIGAEYMHINETEQKRWIQKRLEGSRATPQP